MDPTEVMDWEVNRYYKGFYFLVGNLISHSCRATKPKMNIASSRPGEVGPLCQPHNRDQRGQKMIITSECNH